MGSYLFGQYLCTVHCNNLNSWNCIEAMYLFAITYCHLQRDQIFHGTSYSGRRAGPMRSDAKAMKNVRDLHKARQSALRFSWMNSCWGFMLQNAELKPLPKSLLKSHRKGEWTSACARARQDSEQVCLSQLALACLISTHPYSKHT